VTATAFYGLSIWGSIWGVQALRDAERTSGDAAAMRVDDWQKNDE
jgi:hypothetical protein